MRTVKWDVIQNSKKEIDGIENRNPKTTVTFKLLNCQHRIDLGRSYWTGI